MSHEKYHFTISERKVYLRVFDIIFVMLALFFVSYGFNFEYFNFSSSHIFIWSFTLIGYLLFFGEVFEMYDLRTASDGYLTLRSTIFTAIFTIIFYVFTPVISPLLPSDRIQILYFSLALVFSLLINRLIYIQLIFAPRFFKNILIIGNEQEIKYVLQNNTHKSSNNIKGYISNKFIDLENLFFEDIKYVDINQIVSKNAINEILVSPDYLKLHKKSVKNQLIELFEKGISIRSLDNFIENETFRITENQLNSNFYNHFTFSPSHKNNLYVAFVRATDIVFSLIGILFFILLIPVVFVANLIGNKGGLFYTQQRVGLKGEPFKIIKFRTMFSNAEENGVKWAVRKDKRITPFGRVLRKTRMDEIPQFINVLKGEMSLIGPRPEQPLFVKQLEHILPYYAIRHVIKPGLTGWAQVMHPYASTVDDQQKKLMFDLYYIKERSLLLDFKIVIKTISTILFFRGT